jgi:hypothetical protein
MECLQVGEVASRIRVGEGVFKASLEGSVLRLSFEHGEVLAFQADDVSDARQVVSGVKTVFMRVVDRGVDKDGKFHLLIAGGPWTLGVSGWLEMP